MSDQNGYRGGPPPEESAYPPLPGEEEEDRQRQPAQYPPPPVAHVTLPPIQDAPAYRFAPGPGPPQDPRSQGPYAASPPGANGHPPPAPGYQLPPVQPPPDQRYGVEQRYDYGPQPRGGAYQPPGAPGDQYNNSYTYRPSYGASSYPEYGRAPPAPAQAAPRQRTSIACSYCRRRKVSNAQRFPTHASCFLTCTTIDTMQWLWHPGRNLLELQKDWKQVRLSAR